jgi:hypothetical protein
VNAADCPAFDISEKLNIAVLSAGYLIRKALAEVI